MSSEKEDQKISKFLSLVLRHKPEEIGIELDEHGWTDVKVLIEKVNQAGVALNQEILKRVVDTSEKKRFAFNDSLNKIRANQGHSVEVELGYKSVKPPSILYHGTGTKAVESILVTGLQKRSRHHVHLSSDLETATRVGQRHGVPFMFDVLSEKMYEDGFEFFLSDNGVWLTDSVPVKYLKEHTNA